MTKTLEDKMNELPEDRREAVKERARQLYIEMVSQSEHEDGSVTYSFDMTEDVASICNELGLKLLLYCGVCGISPAQGFETIWAVHLPDDPRED